MERTLTKTHLHWGFLFSIAAHISLFLLWLDGRVDLNNAAPHQPKTIAVNLSIPSPVAAPPKTQPEATKQSTHQKESTTDSIPEPSPTQPKLAPQPTAKLKPENPPQPKAVVKSTPEPVKPKPQQRQPVASEPMQPVNQAIKAPVASHHVQNMVPSQKTDAPQHALSSRQNQQSRESIKLRYLQKLQMTIRQHQHYPRLSRRRSEQGKVLVSLLIDRDGLFHETKVVTSSGYRRLDEAALNTLRDIQRFAPIPDELGKPHWRIRVPLVFALAP